MGIHQTLLVGGESAVDPDFASVMWLTHDAISDSSSYARALNTNIGVVAASSYAPGAINGNVLDGLGNANPYVVTAANQTGSEFTSNFWTVELRYYRTTSTGRTGLWYHNQNLGITVGSSADGAPANLDKVLVVVSGIIRLVGSTALTHSTWYSIAVSMEKVGANYVIRLFVNGVLDGSATIIDANAAMIASATQMDLGRHDQAGFRGILGYVEEYRVSTVCRYTANYTPRTTPFPNAGP